MGKNKQKFNKKQAVRFTLVPGFDENGKPVTHFRPVEIKKSKVNSKQRERIIQQISDQVYDEIQINGKKVGQNQIPAFILQQIKGRKDLIFNQNGPSEVTKGRQAEGDLYQVVDANDYDDEEEHPENDKQKWEDEENLIQEQEYDDDEMFDEEQGEWEDEQQMEDVEVEDQQQIQKEKETSKFTLNESDFPELSSQTIRQYQLTEEQIKLLDVLIPQNYQQFQIKGLKFEKYDDNGLPLSQKHKFQDFIATGKQGIVDSFIYVPQNPTPIYDNDLKPTQIKGQLKQVEDALNFEGEEEVYDTLQDDFFAKLIKEEIQENKKQNKIKKQKKKESFKKQTQMQQALSSKPTKILEKKADNQPKQNAFSKYDDLDDDILDDQITEEMLEKALDDFENNLQTENKGKHSTRLQQQQQIQQQDYHPKNNASMSFSEIQKCEELFGRDGQLDWRCLTKKQKKQYMRTKIIRSFYDEVRERQIEEKLKGKRNVTSEELHLKSMVEHITYQEDHVMRKALQQDAKEQVNLEEDSSDQSQSDQENIVEFHQRTSVISSNLNEIREPSNKRKKLKTDKKEGELGKQLDQLSATMQKLKTSSQKRERNQTKEERKQRKQRQKQVKKQKKQVKKQFSQKFNQQKRKYLKMNKPSDPLHKVSYVKIM